MLLILSPRNPKHWDTNSINSECKRLDQDLEALKLFLGRLYSANCLESLVLTN